MLMLRLPSLWGITIINVKQSTCSKKMREATPRGQGASKTSYQSNKSPAQARKKAESRSSHCDDARIKI
jgi:hypothetical protein